MELNKEKFWTTIFCDNKIISKVELSNAEEKYPGKKHEDI